MNMLLSNRQEAGKLLALKLASYTNHPDGLILALPRGGVPVGFEIAKTLNLPLDVFLVRKLGVPTRKELGMGALAINGLMVINEDIINSLNISSEIIQKVADKEWKELQRRNKVYRKNQPLPIIEDHLIIVVDDGIATGATLKVALDALHQQKPKTIIVAAPILPISLCKELETKVDSLVYLKKLENFHSISLWYQDFTQVSDQEVCQLLELAKKPHSKMEIN